MDDPAILEAAILDGDDEDAQSVASNASFHSHISMPDLTVCPS